MPPARPTLIAETPNARVGGRFVGHRFLVAPGSPVTDDEAAEAVGRCRRSDTGVGDTWIGVTDAVVQAATGRPAEQTLVVVGINVPALSADERAAVCAALKAHLTELEATAAAIPAEEGRFVIEVSALAGWCDPRWPALPALPPPPSLPVARTPQSRLWPRLLAVAALAVAVAVVGYALWTGSIAPGVPADRRDTSTGVPPAPDTPPPPPKSALDKFRDDLAGLEKLDDVTPGRLMTLWDMYGKNLSEHDRRQVLDAKQKIEEAAAKWITSRVDAALKGPPQNLATARAAIRSFVEEGKEHALAGESKVKQAIRDSEQKVYDGLVATLRSAPEMAGYRELSVEPLTAAVGCTLAHATAKTAERDDAVVARRIASWARSFDPFPNDRKDKLDPLLKHLDDKASPSTEKRR